jgi:hypothetical protein
VGTLQSILDVCAGLGPGMGMGMGQGAGSDVDVGGMGVGAGTDLRQLCPVLERLSDMEHIDLEVYCRDVLMEGFNDALALGNALESMERQIVPRYEYCLLISFYYSITVF